jgi:hypothetical protein
MRLARLASFTGILLFAAGGTLINSSTAAAAVPNRFGYALFSGGIVSQQVPAGTVVAATVPGRYTVTFPGQGIAGGVVHVVAVHDATATPPGRWCQAESWGPVGANEQVKVACYNPAGVLDPLPGFSVLFTQSNGGPLPGLYGYVYSNAAGGILTQYNSNLAANAVAHPAAGTYTVTFTALGTPGPNDGSLQVTAVNPRVGARCKVATWASGPAGQNVTVQCYNPAGALANNAFTISYQFQQSLYGPAFPPNHFGYLWNIPALGPPPTNFNSLAAGNVLAVGPPVWTATFNAIAFAPGNVQVTAFGGGPAFCGLVKPWVAVGANLVAQVNCFNNAGAPINSGFFASYSAL